MGRFVAALDEEIAELRAALESDIRYLRLKDLERVRHERYGDEPATAEAADEVAPTAQPRQPPSPPMRRTSPERQRAIEAARLFLVNHAAPVPTSRLYDHVVGLGIPIAGTNPQNNLSAMLSNADTIFQSNGRSGWTLRSEPKADDADEAQEVGEDDAYERSKGDRAEQTEQAEQLRREIAEHDRRYFQDDAPTISDADYDAMRRRLDEIDS